ncbi:uncharacterized protein KY384_006241 [Bacidia gigantensis]|uniref:uncharacterized protein n=1 Tax=Bacidia gigantensis TaxID=2732470 RepID=UPI001D04D45C|nr:uncharacterized protein KY384_006241 [Bacidia gigantensis]KAG8529604.1 hypothetical protein KY384_006241 [Bacidia gigantensis]
MDDFSPISQLQPPLENEVLKQTYPSALQLLCFIKTWKYIIDDTSQPPTIMYIGNWDELVSTMIDGLKWLPAERHTGKHSTVSTIDLSNRMSTFNMQGTAIPRHISRIENFPAEIRELLLYHVPDAHSLRSLALTSTTFFSTFLGAKDPVKAVLRNEFSPDVLSDAQAARWSAKCGTEVQKLKQPRPEVWQGQLMDFLDKNVKTSWAFSDSLALTELRFYVDYFAEKYSRSICDKLQIAGHLRPQEVDRIRTAFYRLETYSNLRETLLWDGIYPQLEEIRAMFFVHFAPWEIEQLVAVYEFLVTVVSEAQNDIEAHDIEIANKMDDVRWLDDGSNMNVRKERQVFRGLAFLYHLDQAKGFQERYELLSPVYYEEYNDFAQNLPQGRRAPSLGRPLHHFNDTDLINRLSTSRTHKTDTAPFTAWKWAHANTAFNATSDLLSQALLGQRECYALRASGYTFLSADSVATHFTNLGPHAWDMSSWPFLQDRAKIRANRVVMDNSIMKRKDLFWKGWRGWYSEGDYSRVVPFTHYKTKYYNKSSDRGRKGRWYRRSNVADELVDSRRLDQTD